MCVEKMKTISSFVMILLMIVCNGVGKNHSVDCLLK